MAGQAELDARLQHLRQKAYLELARLPPFDTTHFTCQGVPLDFTTYRETFEDGSIQIVVQAYMFRRKILLFFKTGSILAKGFRTSRTGETETMAERELYEFM